MLLNISTNQRHETSLQMLGVSRLFVVVQLGNYSCPKSISNGNVNEISYFKILVGIGVLKFGTLCWSNFAGVAI